LDSKSHPLALFGPILLEWGCGAQCGVKRQVIGFPVRRAGLNVAAAFALGMRLRATSGVTTGDSIQRVCQLARGKSLPNLNFFPAFPPVRADGIEDLLLGRLGWAVRIRVLARDLGC